MSGDRVVVSRPHDAWGADVAPARWTPVEPGGRPHGPARGLVAWLAGALVVALPVGGVVWPGDQVGRRHGRARIVETLQAITTAQTLFAQGDRERDGLQDLAVDLQELVDAGLIAPPDDADAQVWAGYRVRMARGHPESGWCVTADPVDPRSGRRFFVDPSGEVSWVSADEAPPLVLDPQAGPPRGWWGLYSTPPHPVGQRESHR